MIQTVQQVELEQAKGMWTVWVDVGLGLKAGQEVVGKDGRRWTVRRVYERKIEPHLLNRGWSVGGLM